MPRRASAKWSGELGPKVRNGSRFAGHDAVVVIAADELDRLMPQTSDSLPFVAFMESLAVDGLDLTRERDVGRDVAL